MKVFKFFLAGTPEACERILNEITKDGWTMTQVIPSAPGHAWVIIAWRNEDG